MSNRVDSLLASRVVGRHFPTAFKFTWRYIVFFPLFILQSDETRHSSDTGAAVAPQQFRGTLTYTATTDVQ